MNVSSTSNSIYVQSPPPVQLQPASAATPGVDPDGDGGSHRTHSGHRAGGMGQALMQALASLGLSVPQDGATPASPTAGSTAAGGSGDDGVSAANGNVKSDTRQFMHALFQAVRDEDTSTAGGATASGSTDGKAGFATGLASLISQVSSGSAPSALQSAFDKLSADLQPAGAASTASTATGATPSASVTLQALLQQFQQTLGYGATSASATVGNLMSTSA